MDLENIDPENDKLNRILKNLDEPTLEKDALRKFYENLYPPFLATHQPDTFKGASSRYFDRINGVHIVATKLSAAYST